MREIAAEAGMATGAAYYYFDSKDALVMAFYAQAQRAMSDEVRERLAAAKTLHERLAVLIGEKISYFRPNRRLLAALTSNIDPKHALSPFGEQTRTVREEDQAFFEEAVRVSGVKLPKEVAPYLPRLLWMYQMGIILFWVYDPSKGQRRTEVLLEKTLTMITVTIRLASLPVLRPLHKLAGELLRTVYGES